MTHRGFGVFLLAALGLGEEASRGWTVALPAGWAFPAQSPKILVGEGVYF